MTYEESKPWRRKILLDLQDRNRRQCNPFAELIKSRKSVCNTSIVPIGYWSGGRWSSGEIVRLGIERFRFDSRAVPESECMFHRTTERKQMQALTGLCI